MSAEGVAERHPSSLYTRRQRGWLLFTLFLVSASNYLDRNIISVLLEPIKAEFQISDTSLGLLSGFSFAIFYATLGIPVARFADRSDRKKLITLALVVWSTMTAACGLAQNFWHMVFARIGVGAGEAGAIPPAQSLIADYFPPHQRGSALAIFMMSATIGLIVGQVIGAQVAAAYGWRMAFIAAGLPGLLLAVMVHLILQEPRRLPEFRVAIESSESVTGTFRALLTKKSYVNLLIAFVLYFLVAYGALIFAVSFLVRSRGLSLAEAGGAYGGFSALSAIFGSLVGGYVTDYLVKRDIRWLCHLPALGLFFCWPFYLAFLTVESIPVLIGLSFVGGIGLTGTIPPMFSALHAVCGSSRRAMAVAISFFFSNLIGLGFGPIAAGMLSDYFGQTYGPAEGLRIAMIIMVTLFLPCSYFMVRAGRYIKAEQET